jgi:hypothetical protein
LEESHSFVHQAMRLRPIGKKIRAYIVPISISQARRADSTSMYRIHHRSGKLRGKDLLASYSICNGWLQKEGPDNFKPTTVSTGEWVGSILRGILYSCSQPCVLYNWIGHLPINRPTRRSAHNECIYWMPKSPTY